MMKNLLLVMSVFLTSLMASGQNWSVGGSSPQSYDMGGDPGASHLSENRAFIRSKTNSIDGFGTLSTSKSPADFRGKAIKLSGYVKSEDVLDYAGFWLRVDDGDKTLSFDNMNSRPVVGSTEWTYYEVVLDVPESSTSIFYGILLAGTGAIEVGGVVLEEVPGTWTLQYAFDSEEVLALDAVNEHCVWASSYSGEFLRTMDGGKNWEHGTIPGAKVIHLFSLCSIDSLQAYVAGASFGNPDTRIYKTTDGGKNWEMQYQSKEDLAFINYMAFWNDSTGIAVGDPVNGSFLILTTRDGGAHWERTDAANIPSPHPGEWGGFGDVGGQGVAVLDGGYAWFGSAYGQETDQSSRVFRTRDYGKTWEATDIGFPKLGFSRALTAIAFKDTLNGFIGGIINPNSELEDQHFTMFQTKDGGLSWIPVDFFSHLTPTSMEFVPGTDHSMLVCGLEQGFALSTDGGKQWARVRSTQRITGVSFSGPEQGWVLGWGNIFWSDNIQAALSTGSPRIAAEFSLEMQVYPNPFSHTSHVSFTLDKGQHVLLQIIDISGRVAEVLLEDYKPAGTHQIQWNPEGLAGGVYFCKIQAGKQTLSRKMIYKK